jgi:hypothetical protein
MKTRAALKELLKRGYKVNKITESTGLARKGKGPGKKWLAEMKDGTLFEISLSWRVVRRWATKKVRGGTRGK